MEKRFAILILLILGLGIGSLCKAQHSFTLSGIVYDSTTSGPLPQTRVVLQGTNKGVMTDEKGRFTLLCDSDHMQVSFSFLGYARQIRTLERAEDQEITVQMAENPIEIGQITIVSHKPQVFHHDYRSQVIDYEHLGENLLIVKFNPEKDRPEMILVDPFDSLLYTWAGPETPGHLERDCLGNVHVLGKRYACQLDYVNGRLVYAESTLDQFKEFIEPCLGELDDHYYEREAGPWSQILTYYYAHEAMDSLYPFETIIDQQKLDHLMEEGLLNGVVAEESEEIDAGVMGDVSLEELKTLRGYAAEIQFLEKVLIKPIYAPLRVLANQVYIFDHHNGRIKVFDQKGSEAQEIPIDYHRSRHWREEVYVDDYRAEAYTQFERNGYITLKQIDLQGGSLSNSWDLPLPFATEITVRDGKLFYLCKDPQDQNHKRLYQWVLK